jgi:hypothetical protein
MSAPDDATFVRVRHGDALWGQGQSSMQKLPTNPRAHMIEQQTSQRRVAADRARLPGWAMVVVAGLAACQPPASPSTAPALAEPAVFATWPKVTEKPIRVDSALFLMCRVMTADEVRARRAAAPNGPHADYSIVVRVSPDAIDAYREGRPLPRGAVVVKEKYANASASGPMQAYALMTKRAVGFDPAGGDWEYAFVTRAAAGMAERGRLASCAGCHASARSRDYLFRSYGTTSR